MNSRASVRMLTLLFRYYDVREKNWFTISTHIFTNQRNTRADYETGMQLIREELNKRNVSTRRLVKVSLTQTLNAVHLSHSCRDLVEKLTNSK